MCSAKLRCVLTTSDQGTKPNAINLLNQSILSINQYFWVDLVCLPILSYSHATLPRAVSYLPLCGDAFVEGDGITPVACAHLEGAEQRDVEAYHIAFVPGLGARLLGTPWYGSPGIIDQWADFLH